MAATTGKLKVGYVPEHFSSPLLQYAAKAENNIELVSCPSGTGQLIKAIKDKDIDVAVALTESLIAGVVKKSAAPEEYRLVGQYVTSPLDWAVIVGAKSDVQSIADLRGKTIGISRIGSGSQVMASYMALKHGWTDAQGQVEPIKFEVLDTFKNLRDGVNDGRAAAFMWENYTTRPYMLSGEMRFLSEHVLTPWPSWSIVANVQADKSAVSRLTDGLGDKCREFDSPESREGAGKQFIMDTFGYPAQDVEGWLAQVSYPHQPLKELKSSTITETLDILTKAGVVSEPEGGWRAEDFVDTELVKLQ